MISAGEIGATLTIVDEVSAVLNRISGEFERLDGVIRETKEALASIRLPPGINTSLGTLDERLAAIGGAAEKGVLSANIALGRLDENLLAIGSVAGEGAAAAASAFGTLDTSINTSIDRVQALKTEMLSVGKVAAVDDMVPVAAGGRRRPPGAYGPDGEPLTAAGGGRGGGREGSGGGGDGGRRHFERHLRGMGRIAGVPAELTSAIFTPEGLAVVGGAYATLKAIEAGARLQHEAVNMTIGGVSPEQVTGAKEDSIRLGDKYGFKADLVAKMLNEIRVPLNSGLDADSGMKAARGLGDDLLRFAVAARAALGPEKGSEALEQLYGAIKSGEMRNITDPEKYGSLISAESQVLTGTGGRVKPNDIQQALKYMKTEGMAVSDDFVIHELPAYIQEFKASTAGQMLSRTYQAFIGGHQTKKSKEEGQRVGLYDDNLEFKYKDDFLTNPNKAFQEIGDALRAHGFTTKEQIEKEVGMIASNPNVGEIITKGILGAPQLQRTTNSINASMGSGDAAKIVSAQDPMQAMDRITSGFNNLGAALTGSQMGSITSNLNQFADALNSAVGPAKAFGDSLNSLQAWISAHTLPKILHAPESNLGPEGKPVTNSVSVPEALKKWWDGLTLSAPAAASTLVPAIPSMPADPLFHPGRDVRSPSTGPYSYTPASLAPNIQGSLQMLPSQVQPAITSAFASIGAAISSAIAGLASSAKAAAGAIQTGGKTTQVQSTTVLNVDGRKLSEAVGSHIITANASVNNSAAADTTSMAGWTDMASYA